MVFTSDHGEGFGEHASYLQGETFYGELLHVPLNLAGPGVRPGQRIGTPVSILDLMPALADLLEAACLESPLGRSFVPLLRGEAPDDLVERDLYALSPLRSEGTDAPVRGALKLIVGDDRTVELYDLRTDPGERRNFAVDQPKNGRPRAADPPHRRPASPGRAARPG